MTKKKQETVKQGWKPGKRKRLDLSELKSLMDGVTFESAVKGYHIPEQDQGIIRMAGIRWDSPLPRKSRITIAHRAYWELFNEHQGS
jgi:hypothetical protein